MGDMPDLTEDMDIKRQIAALMNLIEDKARAGGCEIETVAVAWLSVRGSTCMAESVRLGDISLATAEMLAENLINAAEREELHLPRRN